MADDDDQEEFLDVEDPDSPGSPVSSEIIQAIEEPTTGSGSPSLTTGSAKTPDKSVSEVPVPEEAKSGSITSGSIQTNGSGSKSGSKSGSGSGSIPGSQHSKKSDGSVEETSRSHEVIRRSQELSLSGKQSSLDRLSEKKETGQRTKISKWQRQCNRQFRDMIGKREMKNEELERQQGDLRQRLNILECSMPAVMVWNIWRMTQGDHPPCLQQVLEKQFQGPASGEVYCPASPSRHFDCRVRETEAERKQAQNRVEEARSLWAEKMASLEDREKRLQEARKLQEEQQRRIEQLTTEVQKLRDARSTEDEGACEVGECGVIECRRKWLEKVPSSASIRSTDIECLEKLQELAEAELCMKRQIGDLERREQAYMRTLQQADELWNCLEGDAAGTIQEQLETKTVRITELEEELRNLRSKMATCREELEKYMSKGKIEALIGRDDDFAGVSDMEAVAGVSVKDGMTSGQGDPDDETEKLRARLAACRDELGKYISVEELEAIVGRDEDFVADGAMKDVQYRGLKPEPTDIEESTVMDAQKLLAQIGSLSELDGPGTFCGPDFDCNDLGLSESGLPEEERIALAEDRVTARELLEKYGLLEIAEQMGAEATGGLTRYKMVVKSEMQRTEDVSEKETRSVVEEVVQREIAYDEEASEHDGVKEEEVGVQEDEVAVKEEEVGVQEDEVAVKEEEVGVQEDEVGVQEDEVGVMKDEVGVIEDEVGEKDSVPSKKAEDVLVPMDQLSSWQDRVHAVRLKITECPSCDTVDREAQIVADELAAYTGRTMKLEAAERIAKDKESLEVKEEMREIAEDEDDEMKLDRREDDKVEFVEADVKEEERRNLEPVDEVESVEKERILKPEPEESVVEARTPEDVKEKVSEEYPRAETPVSKDVAATDEKVKVEEVLEETVPRETRREPTEVKERDAVPAAEVKSERLAEVDEVKPVEKEKVVEEDEETKKEEVTEEEEAVAKKERVLEVKSKEETPPEKKDAEEVPETAAIKEQVEDRELEGTEPEPAVKKELEKVPEKEPEIKVQEREIKPEETVSEEDEVEEVPVERLEEFEVAVEVDIITAEEEPEPEEKEIVRPETEVEVVVVKEEPTEEKEAPEEIVPQKEEPKPEEEGIIPEEVRVEEIPVEVVAEVKVEEIPVEVVAEVKVEEIPVEVVAEVKVEEIPVEVVAELKPEEIVPEEEEIKVDVIPKEEPLRPEVETIVEIPLEKAEEEIKAEVPETEKIELEVKVLEDAKVAEVDVEIEIAPVEVLKEEKDEEVPEEPEEIEISVEEECVCNGVYDVEYLFPPVTEEEHPVGEEESVCQCMAQDYPPEDEEEPGDCQCSTDGPPDEEEEPADCQCMNGDLQDQAGVTPVEKEDSGVCKCTSKAPSEEKTPSVKKEDSDVCKCTSKAPSEEKTSSVGKEDSGVCKCISQLPVKEEESGVCQCTSQSPTVSINF